MDDPKEEEATFTSDIENYIKYPSAPSTPTINKNHTLNDEPFKVMEDIKAHFDRNEIRDNPLCKLIASITRGDKNICILEPNMSTIKNTTNGSSSSSSGSNNDNGANAFTIGNENYTCVKIIDK